LVFLTCKLFISFEIIHSAHCNDTVRVQNQLNALMIDTILHYFIATTCFGL